MRVRYKHYRKVLGLILVSTILMNSISIFNIKTTYGDTKNLSINSTNNKQKSKHKNNKVVFGVISDTHVAPYKPIEISRLSRSFKFMNKKKADAIAVVGDLTDNGSKSEYDTWKTIKNANKGNMKLVASMGNHEGNSADLFIAATGDKPNANYIINGYHFITLSPGSGVLNSFTGKGTTQGGGDYSYVVNWLQEQLTEAVQEDPTKPIFVFFHHPLQNTYYTSNERYGTGLSTGKDETFKSVFSKFPQAVTFSGHTHAPNNNPTSIWQDGGFTAINTSTLSYGGMESGMVNGSVCPKDAHMISQQMIVEVNGSKVKIHNYDLIANKYLPITWQFDVTKPSTFLYTKSRNKQAKPPIFLKDNSINITNIKDTQATLKFKQAKMETNNLGDIVECYRYDFINEKTGHVYKSFKNWSEYYVTPPHKFISQKVTGLIPGTNYIVKIYAIDAFKKVCELPLCANFTTTGVAPNEITISSKNLVGAKIGTTKTNSIGIEKNPTMDFAILFFILGSCSVIGRKLFSSR